MSHHMQVLQPPGWAQPKGYANGIAAHGRLVFVAGQVGWTPQAELVEGGFVAQARQALANIVAVVAQAGGRPQDLVRLTWYVADAHEYLAASRELGVVYREIIGRHYPVMTAIQVAGFVEPGVRVEIEATAVIPDAR